MKQYVKVSDWSQKWKIFIYIITILGFSLFVYYLVMPYAEEILKTLKQIEINTKK